MKKKNENTDLNRIPRLNIENLLRTLEQLSKEQTRISRARIDEIFRALRFELPYSVTVVNAALATALYSDSPHDMINTSLNEVIIHLCKALINPNQTAALAQAVQTYFQARKKSEKEYAANIAETLLETNNLDAFPKPVWPFLYDLTLTIMDRIITEKLSRRIPGYKSQSVLELIRPFLQFRLANAELEKAKIAQPQVFKRWITNIVHDGYEKINDEKRFNQIQQEKETAFNNFKAFVTSKSQSKANLSRYIDKISFSQQDKNGKFDDLEEELDDFLPANSILEKSTNDLRWRFFDKLRKLFAAADKNPELFESEENILASQEESYEKLLQDIKAIKKIIKVFTDIQKNYSKNFMATLVGRDHMNNMQALLLDALLGSLTNKRDMASGALLVVRDGGYPQKNMTEIYNALIPGLRNLQNTAKGMFSAALKLQIDQGIQELTEAKNLLPDEPTSTPTITQPPPVQVEIPAVTKPVVEAAKNPAEKTPEPVKEIPIAEKISKPVVEPAKKIPVAEKPAKPVIEPSQETSAFKKMVKPGYKSQKEITEPYVPPFLRQETENPVEQPEQTKEDGDSERLPIVELEPAPTPAPTGTDPGLAVMNNYQLGQFTAAVHEAWKVMLVKAASQAADLDINTIAQEQEVNLYVICELVQKVAGIKEETLSPENKEMLQSITTLLRVALKNPSEENNWTFFEGARRDDVDRAIEILKAS